MSTSGSASIYGATSTSSNTTAATSASSDPLDKNAFMKILVAEISNQDPTAQNSDPDQYVSELAQFSSLEQMTNLNDTMTLSGASSLIGQTVELNQTDSSGNNIQGVVKSVTKNGDDVTLELQATGTTTLQQYDYSDVLTINPDATATVAAATPVATTQTSATS